MNQETYNYEDRMYLNPETSRDEQLGFVDRLREMQQSNIDKIARDTHNLGTDISSPLGGLSGSGNVWAQRYVTPATNQLVSNLKSTAQASALNTALSNLQEQYKKKYQDAYRAASKRASGGGSGGSNGTTYGDGTPDEKYVDDLRTAGGNLYDVMKMSDGHTMYRPSGISDNEWANMIGDYNKSHGTTVASGYAFSQKTLPDYLSSMIKDMKSSVLGHFSSKSNSSSGGNPFEVAAKQVTGVLPKW